MLFMLVSRVLLNPTLDNFNLVVDNFHHTRIRLTIPQDQIAAVDTAWNDVDRSLVGRLQRTAGSEVGRHGGVLPGVELAVGPDKTGRVDVVPPAGIGVDILVGFALGDAVRVAILGRDEQGALAFPIRAVDKSGHDSGNACWSTVLPKLEAGETVSKVLEREIRGWKMRRQVSRVTYGSLQRNHCHCRSMVLARVTSVNMGLEALLVSKLPRSMGFCQYPKLEHVPGIMTSLDHLA